ncbi:MAG: hypothetical protein EBZ77_16750, partial [Chitinophagia bacterium]|nr:hypothetical protein [Chitinophagia bacterium]
MASSVSLGSYCPLLPIVLILSEQFNVHTTPGNFNNHIGLPLTLLMLQKSHEIAVIEMGANHVGENLILCEIAKPNLGLVTNNGKDHLEGFGDMDNLYNFKPDYNAAAANIASTAELAVLASTAINLDKMAEAQLGVVGGNKKKNKSSDKGSSHGLDSSHDCESGNANAERGSSSGLAPDPEWDWDTPVKPPRPAPKTKGVTAAQAAATRTAAPAAPIDRRGTSGPSRGSRDASPTTTTSPSPSPSASRDSSKSSSSRAKSHSHNDHGDWNRSSSPSPSLKTITTATTTTTAAAATAASAVSSDGTHKHNSKHKNKNKDENVIR